MTTNERLAEIKRHIGSNTEHDLVAALEAVLERHLATEETSDGRRWCVHCYDRAGNMIEAPCPTVQAVTKALGVDQ